MHQNTSRYFISNPITNSSDSFTSLEFRIYDFLTIKYCVFSSKWQTEKKKPFWTNNKKIVFFFNCSNWDIFIEKIRETNWWKHMMNSIQVWFSIHWIILEVVFSVLCTFSIDIFSILILESGIYYRGKCTKEHRPWVVHEKYRFFLVFFGPLSLCFVFCEKIFCKIQHNCKNPFTKLHLNFLDFHNLFNFSKNVQIEKIEKKSCEIAASKELE